MHICCKGSNGWRRRPLPARAPEPIIKIEEKNFTPALYNDAELAKKTAKLLRHNLGDDRVKVMPPIMGGEDFSRYGLAGVPIFFYFIGTVDPQKYAASLKPGGEPLPSIHSDLYAPVPNASIRTGVLSMSLAGAEFAENRAGSSSLKKHRLDAPSWGQVDELVQVKKGK